MGGEPERGSRKDCKLSRQKLKGRGTHKGREADAGKAPKGGRTTMQAERCRMNANWQTMGQGCRTRRALTAWQAPPDRHEALMRPCRGCDGIATY